MVRRINRLDLLINIISASGYYPRLTKSMIFQILAFRSIYVSENCCLVGKSFVPERRAYPGLGKVLKASKTSRKNKMKRNNT